MNGIVDIGWGSMCLGFLLLLIPVTALAYYRTGLVKDTLIAASRMTLQLFLIGFYLEYLFTWNSAWINLLWVIVMPVIVAFFCSICFIDVYFLGIIIKLDHLFEARYFVPVSGMILGYMLSANVIALNVFYGSLDRERQLYFYLLANGATRGEATAPFMREALIKSFNPTIASMAVMGLVALPGTMTGQILGGSSPNVAIKYQIMLMITIFSSSLISVLLTLWAAKRRSFDSWGIKRF